jgi:hypothetical protein
VHGEPEKRDALAAHLAGAARHAIRKPEPGEAVVLSARGATVGW